MKRYIEEKEKKKKKDKEDKKEETTGSTVTKKDLGLSENAKVLME